MLRFFLCFCGVLFFILSMSISCVEGGSECIKGIQVSEYNPSGLSCTTTCDCSNLKYEGHCIQGRCLASERTKAQRKGETRRCKLLQKVGACEWGLQEAQPEPLKDLLWGDCIPPTPVPEDSFERCFDGIDNDCNGFVDQNDSSCSLFCRGSQPSPCYEGALDTLNQGRCRSGLRACLSEGIWGECQGSILPKKEICNNEDDDCNGLIDDGLVGCPTTQSCRENDIKPCYHQPNGCLLENAMDSPESFSCLGECRAGTQRCIGNAWGNCEGAITPQKEICDGKDNDCNGLLDDGLTGCSTTERCIEDARRPCYFGTMGCSVERLQGGGQKYNCIGLCRTGMQRCVQGFWDTCLGEIKPQSERCNGYDDDCNGLVDDGAVCPNGELCVRGVCVSEEKRDEVATNTEKINDLGSQDAGEESSTESFPEKIVETNTCSNGQVLCAGVCVDVSASTLHCGNCGNACSTGQSCINGICSFPAGTRQVFAVGTASFPMRFIPAGSFLMGSPETESFRNEEEVLHQVTLSRGFWILETEVTQAMFRALGNYDPSFFHGCGLDCPVESVTWSEVAAYANAASRAANLAECFSCTGSGKNVTCFVAQSYQDKNYYNCRGYRLPTEAEWEYSYRAGTTTAFYSGQVINTSSNCTPIDSNANTIGWYFCNSHVTYPGCFVPIHPQCKGTNPVKRKQPNAWGLYDMAGNVFEWTYDSYGAYGTSSVTDPVLWSNSSQRVLRGGGWDSQTVRALRGAARDKFIAPSLRSYNVGFRLVRSAP